MRETIAQALMSKISDPRIDPLTLSVTRVEVADDLLTAKVYVSVLGEEVKQRLALRALTSAAGRIQELMMRKITLRHTPLLEFVVDETFKKTLETLDIIDRAMEEIRDKEGESLEGEDAADVETPGSAADDERQ